MTYKNYQNDVQEGCLETCISFVVQVENFYFVEVELLKEHEDELREVGLLQEDFA